MNADAAKKKSGKKKIELYEHREKRANNPRGQDRGRPGIESLRILETP